MKLCTSLFHPTITIFFLSFLVSTHVSYAKDDYKLCKNNYTCGDINVGYPFWGGDRLEFCGHPGFKLSCLVENYSGRNYSVIDMEGKRFRVLQIDDSEYILRIARFDLWPIPCNYDKIANNTQLDYRFFNFLENANENLDLFYDCNGFRDSDSDAGDFNCSNGSPTIKSIYYVKESLLGIYNMSSWFPDCYKKSTKVPILKDLNIETLATDLQDSINQGFDVQYIDIGLMCKNACEKDKICVLTVTGNITCIDKDKDKDKGKKSWKLWLGIGAAAAILLILATYCLIRRKNHMTLSPWKKTQADLKVEAFLREYGSLAPKRYMYSEIKKMTDSFKEKLGQGGFGAVYKGKSPNGCLVAVKLLNISKGNGEDFINEVASISRTSHVNVVTLLGFCLQGRKRALVYEFMPNGSLEKFIFNKKTTVQASHQLGWEKLYHILVGIARGLEYLHRGCNTRILHFDIKPHNILLDDDFSPKISDFGLAKLCSAKDSKISMLEARGTIGYIAPEVFSRNFGPVSHKSDVYSYGMMVLEMVGGRKNLDVGVSDLSEMYFPHWIYKRLELGAEFQGLQGVTTGKETEIVKKMILVGLWCIQTNPSDRPAISD